MKLNMERIGKVATEASKILKDYPHLKYYQAIEMAREVLKEKAPSAATV